MFRNFFRGRYGLDNLSLVLLLAAVIFLQIKYLWVIGYGLFGYVIFRTISKDINKRNQEQQKFSKLTKRFAGLNKGLKAIRKKYAEYKIRVQQRKLYVFLRCPKCKKTLRLPKNKGKLSVTCPVCKGEFLKKT